MIKKINFAKNLRLLRKSCNMTQNQLAEALMVDQRTISAWENGVCEPNFDLLAKLCAIFDQSFDEILT